MNSLVVMGVAGCGKSSLGQAVAQAIGRPLIEGDDFHSESNRAKMRAAVPLTDADRDGWLDALTRELARHSQGVVLTCSALKRSYRDVLRGDHVVFVYLAGSHDQIARRLSGGMKRR